MAEYAKLNEHFKHGDLLGAITSGITQLAETLDTVTIEDLAAVDEFHIGGRRASEDFLDQLGISGEQHLVDVGCGLGGTARFVADRYKCRVTGIDLIPEYIYTGNILCNWLGLDDRVTLLQGSALSLPFDDSSFDGAYMMHVGMNIEDKAGLFSEIARVLRQGSLFGIYDVMRIGEGEISYPVPWAASAATSEVVAAEHYKKMLQNSGFTIQAERNRHEFAVDYFAQLRINSIASKARPPLGLHILMGDTAPIKVKNLAENISAGRIAPVELIARKS